MESKQRLSKASVGIAGAGGLGSHVAIALARAGIGRLLVVDFDVVEARNLDRQCYTLEQIGMPKVEALAMNIAAFAPSVEFRGIVEALEKGRMAAPFRGVDVVVEALDDAASKAALIEEVMLGLPGTPIVAASGVGGWGGSGRIVQRTIGTLTLIEDPDGRPCDEVALTAPRVGLFAHWQANAVLEMLLGGECR